jgi:hypothetical protein
VSSNQTLILNAIDSRMAVLLPNHKRLDYSYELEKNSTRSDDSWGAGAGSSDWTTGVTKSVTLDSNFFVVIGNKFTNRSNDNGEIAALKEVYDNIETVFLDFASSKLGISSTVLVVESLTLDEPEKIGKNIISVKANFVVKHRKATT